VDTNGSYMAMGKHPKTTVLNCHSAATEVLFECERAAPTQAHGKRALKKIVERHAVDRLKPAMQDVLRQAEGGAAYESLQSSVGALASILAPSEPPTDSLSSQIDEASAWAKAQMAGTTAAADMVFTGLKKFDTDAGPILPHEYVVVGARTSTGKSSFINQLASHNLTRGLKVVIFTLETSARAVICQIASQRTETNLRYLAAEFPVRQQAYLAEIEKLRKADLLVFDRDLSLDRVESRCRLLAAQFKPNLVIIDYLGLMRVKADGAYERMTALSKAMIPLKKSLGCALVVAAQLNRGNEKDDRRPQRTDFRDSGSIEEDAQRIIALYRPRKDGAGQEQTLDRSEFETEVLQLKNRDGPLAHTFCDYHCKYTKFVEKVH